MDCDERGSICRIQAWFEGIYCRQRCRGYMWDSIVINMYGVRISVVAVARLESLQFLAFIINDNGDMTRGINLLTAWTGRVMSLKSDLATNSHSLTQLTFQCTINRDQQVVFSASAVIPS